jgi:hypothetical protein
MFEEDYSQEKVFCMDNFFNYLHDTYDEEICILIVIQIMVVMLRISNITKENFDTFDNKYIIEDKIVMQYHTSAEDINKIEFLGDPYLYKFSPKQKTSLKSVGNSTDMFEIVIDFDPKTVAKTQGNHSSKNVKTLAKVTPICLRIFFKLGDITEIEYSSEKSYKTYKKIVFAVFDKSNMEQEKYNKITDEIIIFMREY